MTPRRTPWREVRWVALDIETTGLSEHDAILSYGAVPIENGRVIIGESVSRMFDPGVPVGTVTVHGIRPSDLRERPMIDVDELRALTETGVLVTWTAWVEAAFLSRTLGTSPGRWRKRMVDVRDLVLAVDVAESRPSPTRPDDLYSTADRFGVPLEGSHIAWNDAFMTAQLFQVCVVRLEKERPMTLRSIQTAGRKPPIVNPRLARFS